MASTAVASESDSAPGRPFVLATLQAIARHYRAGQPVRLGVVRFPYDDWYRYSRAEGWRSDSEMVAAYDSLRRAVGRARIEIEPFEYLVGALARQAGRSDTVAMAELIGLLRGSDGHFTEVIEEEIAGVFRRRPALVIQSWCADPPDIELVVGDESDLARARRTVRLLVRRGVVADTCAQRFLRSLSTW